MTSNPKSRAIRALQEKADRAGMGLYIEPIIGEGGRHPFIDCTDEGPSITVSYGTSRRRYSLVIGGADVGDWLRLTRDGAEFCADGEIGRLILA